jgi:hypothetical protein
MTERPPVTQSTDDHAVGAALPKASAGARSRGQHAEPSPHAHRFRTATAVLVGLGVGAIIIAVAVAIAGNRNSSQPPAPWSAWSPPDSGTLGARDIADHVAPLYRLSAVDQLSVITVVNLESAAQAAAAAAAQANGTPSTPSSGLQVAVRTNPSSSAVSLLGGNTIAYNLCGIGGKNCAIAIGSPSAGRLLLLRREALELALYTFKYIHGAENVVAILPPGHAAQTSTLTKSLPTSNSAASSKPVNMAVLFERQALAPLLSHQLTDSLPEQFPPTVAEMPKAPEAGLVDQVTANGLFSEQVQQAQDGSSLIVLDPLPPS